MNNQLQLAFEQLQDAWAALTNLFCFWKAQDSEE